MSAPAMTAPTTGDDKGRSVVLYMQGTKNFSPSWNFEKVTDAHTGVESQVLRIKDMPVFRSGSFKDSLGELMTWETLHIDQMAQSFAFLKEHDVFPEVPVREGHGSFFGDPMTGLVGYHDALRTTDAVAPDGNTYRYLLADFSLYKEEHQNSFLSGLWRNRSSEVGYYESNDGTGYYPVYQGFAFVDIPAVQFLNTFSKNKQRSFGILLEQELETMTAPATTDAPRTVNPDGSAAPGEPEETPEEKAAREAAETAQREQDAAAAEAERQRQAEAAAAAAAGNHSQGGQAFTFTLGGNRQTTDFAAVQAHIVQLEADNAAHLNFAREQDLQARRNYIKSLADDGKIFASEIDDLTEEVLDLSVAQYAKFKARNDKKAPNPLFARHAQPSTETPEESELSADERQFAALCDRVNWHRLGGMLDAQVRETESFKQMTALATKLGKDPV